ncbi:MAG: LemA family protein [bacterium]|nr:LemA family protein [bacterium]
MKKGVVFIGILVLLAIIAGMWFVKTRNQMVEMEEKVNESWSQVENVYQRRLDLIPNLVATVKGYASHERETLEAVIQARANATKISGQALQNALNDPQSFAKFQQAQGALSSALSKLMVVVERYPELKANKNFLELQAQLEGTENRIAVERRRFNEVAKVFNVKIRRWPDSFVASLTGFFQRPYFSAEVGAEKAPTVDFGNQAPAGQGP